MSIHACGPHKISDFAGIATSRERFLSLNQQVRCRTSQRAQVLVATDVAARGLDVKGITLVVTLGIQHLVELASLAHVRPNALCTGTVRIHRSGDGQTCAVTLPLH